MVREEAVFLSAPVNTGAAHSSGSQRGTPKPMAFQIFLGSSGDMIRSYLYWRAPRKARPLRQQDLSGLVVAYDLGQPI